MEGDSCSSICFNAVNVKNDPEYGFDEKVHVKEEVVECLKEEAAWEDSAAAGEAAALASLYAGHEVKDELVRGSEGLQPREDAFTLSVHVKEEVVECLKEEAAWEDSAAAGEVTTLASLYAGHEVKDELVLGPEGLQPRDNAFTLYAAQALAVKEHHELRDCVARLERIEDPAPLSIQQPHSRHGAGQEDSARGGRGEGREPTRAQDWRHACLICRKDFATPSKLKRHELTHTGERPFSCGICKQKFTQLGNLKKHERTHTGERPFSCAICNKKFTRLDDLNRHGRTHTGERPFSCGICKQKFTESGHLKRHELTHTGERPFSCGICKQKFTQLANLKKHERTHTGERPYSCGICQQKFTQSSHLKRHERIHS